MTEVLVFRDAVPADSAALAALARETFTETFGHLYTPENLAAFLATHSERSWREELTDPSFTVRVGACAERLVAYAKLGPPSLPFEVREPTMELRQFYLLKPWQGTGAARTLMDWVLGESRRRGAEALYLSVFVDNVRAKRFYQRYGFEAVGRYDFMVGTHADEDIIMRLRLRQ
jgi:diamine N-acetyltransferase